MRRQLKDAPPGYVLVSNITGSGPVDTRALAKNISAVLVSSQLQRPVHAVHQRGLRDQAVPGSATLIMCGDVGSKLLFVS